MSSKIFVNLPVSDLDRSIAFFRKIGFTLNPKFTDQTAACMQLTDDIYAMLLTRPKFAEFTSKPIADARQTSEVLICLSMDSRKKVDQVLSDALDAGGKEPRPATDYGFMYQRSFEDPDGHIWEIIWMDPAMAETGPEAATGQESPAVAR